MPSQRPILLEAGNYDLNATLASGQTFHFARNEDSWEGVVGSTWVRLRQKPGGILVEPSSTNPRFTLEPVADFLQIHTDIQAILRTFPKDPVMARAVETCGGLRLLKQDPWQALASFILSSTKQIVQIEQMVRVLSEKFGTEVDAPGDALLRHAFPQPARLSKAGEAELRNCKLGFRAPYLLAAARAVDSGRLNLDRLKSLSLAEARAQLCQLPGVGPKIADCALLFSGAQPKAFPVDVWIARALRKFYFADEEIPIKQLEAFAESHFGSNSGYAQQYLFHYMRVCLPQPSRRKSKK